MCKNNNNVLTVIISPSPFFLSPLLGISSLRQVQAPPPSSPRQLPATLWQQAQCTPHPPGRCRGTPCPALPSSSRNRQSTAHGGKMQREERSQSPVHEGCWASAQQ